MQSLFSDHHGMIQTSVTGKKILETHKYMEIK